MEILSNHVGLRKNVNSYIYINIIQAFYIIIIITIIITIIIIIAIITSNTAQGGAGSFKNRKPIGEIGSCESRMAERITDGPTGG